MYNYTVKEDFSNIIKTVLIATGYCLLMYVCLIAGAVILALVNKLGFDGQLNTLFTGDLLLKGSSALVILLPFYFIVKTPQQYSAFFLSAPFAMIFLVSEISTAVHTFVYDFFYKTMGLTVSSPILLPSGDHVGSLGIMVIIYFIGLLLAPIFLWQRKTN